MDRPADHPDPFEGVDWSAVWLAATALARSQHVREQDVDDLVTMGIERVIGGSAPWDPGARALTAHVVAVGYNALREERRKTGRRYDKAFKSKFNASYDETRETRKMTPEDAVLKAEQNHLKDHLMSRLQGAFGGDPEAAALVECEMQGVHEPAAQAERTGLGIGAVRNARKRMKRKAHELLAQDDPAGYAEAEDAEEGPS